MLWLNQVEKSFGPQTLFENVNWQVNPKQRVGLIGPNGVGKSTLFRIIMGMMEADGGDVHHIRDLTLGYLPQEMAALQGKSIRQEARLGLSRLWAVQQEVENLAQQLADLGQNVSQDLLDRYGQVQARFEQLGGFEAESQVEQILGGLGFRLDELDRPCEELSGGWQMRVVLARLLLQRPDILLLDEPTNHLDLESVGWLKHFLNDFDGSLILISHDRWFLNEICTHIAELTPMGLTVYTGHFESYLHQVEQRKALLERQRKNQAQKLASLERFIDRFRYKASKAKQVQSRVKQLEKMKSVDEHREEQSIHFHLPDPPKSGRVLMTLEDIHQGYSENQLIYQGLDLKIERGKHLALVGPNGAGKSTLLKILAGEVRCQSGERILGHLLQPYYFAQHQAESLNLDWTVFEEAQSANEAASTTYLRSLLGAFLFDADDLRKKVGVLSGGEKNRLALVKMLLTPANLLLLDEPTNHLDMGSRAVLGQALHAFEGAVILISHDRYFIDEVCDEIWEVAEGRVTPYLCDYSDYLTKRTQEDRPSPFPLHGQPLSLNRAPSHSPSSKTGAPAKGATPQSPPSSASLSKPRNRKEEKRLQTERRVAKSRALKPLKIKVENLETEVNTLETQCEALEQLQLDPEHYTQPTEVVRVAQEIKKLKSQLEIKYNQWEEAELELEELESSFE